MADLLIVASESLWPPVDGGRLRTARLAEVLSERYEVVVVAPEGPKPPPSGLSLHPLPGEAPPSRLVAVASLRPRLGTASLGCRRQAALVEAIARHRPRRLLFAHGYLAAVAPAYDLPVHELPVIVDFADLEVVRQSSLARRGSARSRAATALEAAKAHRWEPRLARSLELALASTPGDEQRLATWGARAVLVPHGADDHDPAPSPAGGPVTMVASFDYPPNADAARFVLDEVWPRLRRAAPGVRLRLVGKAAARVEVSGGFESVEVVSDPDDVGPYYEEASLVLAPVVSGGGAQLKVTEALSRGRVVVATTYSARSAPGGTGDGVVVVGGAEELAAAAASLWGDVEGRRVRERVLADRRPVPTWREACAPLLDELERVGSRP